MLAHTPGWQPAPAVLVAAALALGFFFQGFVR